MLIKKQFVYPELHRMTREDGVRHYVCPDSQKHLPSVTTILSATSDKDFSAWEARVGKAEADRQRKYGTDLGTLVHTHLECHMLNEERPGGNNLIRVESKRMADVVIERGLPEVEEIWGIETALYMPELYAGTTDVVGLFRGKQSIIDFKTAKKMRKREDIDDYRDQLAAYLMAHNEKYGTQIEQGVVMMVDRELNYESYVYGVEEMQAGCESFLNRVSAYYERNYAVA